MKFQTTYERNGVLLNGGVECLDESRAVQSQKDDADINVIVKRFGLTGSLPQVRPKIPLEADFREAGQFDLGAALRYVKAATDAFMSYPAEIRARFGNDPSVFCDFVENPDNKDECIRLGILAKDPDPVKPAVVDVRVVSEPKASA